MDIVAYGEDALTLWALQNRLREFLDFFDDPSISDECIALFRPSFGRRGGDNGAQFGEFDFILLSRTFIYLGESKWDNSSEKIRDGHLALRPEQETRHALFQFYIKERAFAPVGSWSDFETQAKQKLALLGISKPIAPDGSLLARNLETVLEMIQRHYPGGLPAIKNVLLYLHNDSPKQLPGTDSPKQLPGTAGKDFMVFPIDYSAHLDKNFIKIKL